MQRQPGRRSSHRDVRAAATDAWQLPPWLDAVAPRTLTVWLKNGFGRRRALISRVAGGRAQPRRSSSARQSTPPVVASGFTDALRRAAHPTSYFRGAAWRSSSTAVFGTAAQCMAARRRGLVPTLRSGPRRCAAMSSVISDRPSSPKPLVGASYACGSARSGTIRPLSLNACWTDETSSASVVIASVCWRRRSTVSLDNLPLRSVAKPKLDFEHQLELSSRHD